MLSETSRWFIDSSTGLVTSDRRVVEVVPVLECESQQSPLLSPDLHTDKIFADTKIYDYSAACSIYCPSSALFTIH